MTATVKIAFTALLCARLGTRISDIPLHSAPETLLGGIINLIPMVQVTKTQIMKLVHGQSSKVESREKAAIPPFLIHKD